MLSVYCNAVWRRTFNWKLHTQSVKGVSRIFAALCNKQQTKKPHLKMLHAIASCGMPFTLQTCMLQRNTVDIATSFLNLIFGASSDMRPMLSNLWFYNGMWMETKLECYSCFCYPFDFFFLQILACINWVVEGRGRDSEAMGDSCADVCYHAVTGTMKRNHIPQDSVG